MVEVCGVVTGEVRQAVLSAVGGGAVYADVAGLSLISFCRAVVAVPSVPASVAAWAESPACSRGCVLR